MGVKIHFLNVGHGDCTIIEHDTGNISVIDVCNGDELDEETAAEIAEELGLSPEQMMKSVENTLLTPYQILKASGYDRELTNPVELYKKTYGTSPIFRYIQSHPDLDHMRGLKALGLEEISIVNFWDTEHTKVADDFLFDDESEWNEYQKHRNGEKGSKILNLYRGSMGHYYNKHPNLQIDGDGLYILAPTEELTDVANNDENWNNHSYVLWLSYKGIIVVLGGDAEKEVWQSIVEKYGKNISCHLLKASHHGRDSGYYEEAVKLMSPVYTIVSVGKKPDTDASNKYKANSKYVLSTRWKGNITCTISDDGKFSMATQYDN